jgi:cobalt-zinc-cadmium efflux system protein
VHSHEHPHSHDRAHGHVHDYSHSPGWAVKVALVITLALVVTEFVAGSLSHSLSLIGDGWHNLSDLPTLILSWIALYFESKPPDEQKTYGYQRAGVLASFVNSLLLVGVALLICYEGYERIIRPEPVAATSMLVVGAVAFVINGSISFALHSWRSDLNMRAVFIHNLGDALSNLAIIAGAWLIARTGQTWIDPLIAFLIAGMIIWSAVGIIRDSSNILLESLPKGMELERVAAVILEVEGVRGVHDVHIWSLGSRSHALSCHLNILDMPTSEAEIIAECVRAKLLDKFGIYHATIQFEHTHLPGECHTYMPGPVPAERK